MPLNMGNVELYMGPKELGGDDLEQPIVEFIDGAKKYLDIAVQELDNENIARAIVRARQRKLTVKLVLEADYLRANRLLAKPWESNLQGSYEINRMIQNAILRTKAYVYSDFNPDIFHQKFIVRDRKELLTGSTNFTDTGTHRNLNNVIIIRNEKVARQYWREFKEICQGRFGKDSEIHPGAPKESVVSNLRTKVLFAPDHNPEMEIMKQMAKAREEISFAIFTFSKTSGIDDQLLAMMNAGVRVRGIFDKLHKSKKWVPIKLLKNAGADIFVVKGAPGLGKLHHKLMVIDKQVVITGSMNYTGPATSVNDENVLVIGSTKAKGAEKTAQKKFAKYAHDEIERMIGEYGA